jgi:uncharacterized cupredoxin-like copper-binding protein
MTRTRRTVLTVAVLTAVLSGCGSDRNASDKSSAPASATAFVLNEWSITPPTIRLKAGKVRIIATNNGSETHELVIVRADDTAALPTKSDGSVDEDKIAEADKPGEIPDLAAGKSATKTLNLSAGNYVAICNLVDQMGNGGMGGNNNGSGGMGNGGMGHVHYRLGMRTQFTVT